MKHFNILLACCISLLFCTTIHAQWTDYGSYIGPDAVNHVYIDGLDGQNLYFENNGNFISGADKRGPIWTLDEGNAAGDNNVGSILFAQYYEYIDNKFHIDDDFDYTNGSLMTFVPSSDRVGVGTDTPSAKFHIAGGDLQLDDTYPFITVNSTASGNAGFAFEDNLSNRGLFFWSSSLDALVMHRNSSFASQYDFTLNRANGNIGINNGLADYKLDVVGDRIRLRDNTTATAKDISLATDITTGVDLQATNTNLKISKWNGTSYDSSIDFTTDIRMESFNNDINIIATNSGGTGTDGDIRLLATDDISLTANVGDILIDADNTNSADGDVFIYADDDVVLLNNGVATIYSTNDNLVGIGVSAPFEKLDVNGAVKLGTTANETVGAIRWTGTDFEGRTNTAWTSLTEGGSGGSLWSQNGASIYFNTGNVGVGTTTPAFDFQVAGDVDVTGELTAASDRQLKKNIAKIDGALEKIGALNPVSYDYRTEEFPEMNLAERRKMGLIAQEVEPVFPNLVSEAGFATRANGEEVAVKSVNYMEMVPVLIKAVQELEAEAKAKDVQIVTMRTQLETLSELAEEVAILKAMLKTDQEKNDEGRTGFGKE